MQDVYAFHLFFDEKHSLRGVIDQMTRILEENQLSHQHLEQIKRHLPEHFRTVAQNKRNAYGAMNTSTDAGNLGVYDSEVSDYFSGKKHKDRCRHTLGSARANFG